ncbi:MAG: hypothetical protein AAF394_16065 [Planctomycetota bacterium]
MAGFLGFAAWMLIPGGKSQAEAARNPDLEALNELRVRLELDKLRLDEQLASEGVNAEQRRYAYAQWLERNEAALESERDLVSRIAQRRRAPRLPNEVPQQGRQSDEEFAKKAAEYLAIGHEIAVGTPGAGEELDAARARLLAWQAQPAVMRLEEQLNEVRQRLADAVEDEAEPVPASELAAMSPLDRAEAEIYNLHVEAFSGPAAPGEQEGRDRLRRVRDRLSHWQNEARRLQHEEEPARRAARIAELEARLASQDRRSQE